MDAEVARMSFVQEDVDTTLATYCGLGFAIICHSTVLIAYAAFSNRSLNCDRYGQTVVQLVGSMLALDLCLLVAYNRYKFDSVHVCTVTAVLAHFFTLSSFLWTVVAGHYVLLSMTAAAIKSSSTQATPSGDLVVSDCRSLSKSLLFAWGIPILPVAITLVIDVRSYQRNVDSCLLASDNKYIYCSVYLLPSSVAVVTNCIIGGAMVTKLCYSQCCARFVNKSASVAVDSTVIVIRVVGLVVVVVLSSLAWLPSVAASLPRFSDAVVRIQYWHCAARSLVSLAALIAFVLAAPATRSTCRRRLAASTSRGPSLSACTGNGGPAAPLTARSSVGPVTAAARHRSSSSHSTERRRASSTSSLHSPGPHTSIHNSSCTGSNRRKPNVTRMYVATSDDENETAHMSTSSLAASRRQTGNSLAVNSEVSGAVADGYATLQPARSNASGVTRGTMFQDDHSVLLSNNCRLQTDDFRRDVISGLRRTGTPPQRTLLARRLEARGVLMPGCESDSTDTALVHTSV